MAKYVESYFQIPERTFTTQVINIARWHGWLCCHFRPARTKNGWVTALEGDQGFPDIVAIRGERALMAELKSAKGKTTVEQDSWLVAAKAAGIEVYLWMPKDIQEIEAILK